MCENDKDFWKTKNLPFFENVTIQFLFDIGSKTIKESSKAICLVIVFNIYLNNQKRRWSVPKVATFQKGGFDPTEI